MLTRLTEHRVAKPWGRTDVPAAFGRIGDGEPLGEVWFQREDGGEDALLVKYLFTSQRLSIQVHPGDQAAVKAGYKRGKDEAWLVLDAEPGAELGIATKQPVSDETLRAAALDGSIVDLIDWRPAESGDVYYSPAGALHSIGAGLTLLEVQQNTDLTYRLYDYGRPRELHLDAGISASRTDLSVEKSSPRMVGKGRQLLVEGPKFTVEEWTAGRAALSASSDAPRWLIPMGGSVTAGGVDLEQPSVWIAEGSLQVEIGKDGKLLVAYEGPFANN